MRVRTRPGRPAPGSGGWCRPPQKENRWPCGDRTRSRHAGTDRRSAGWRPRPRAAVKPLGEGRRLVVIAPSGPIGLAASAGGYCEKSHHTRHRPAQETHQRPADGHASPPVGREGGARIHVGALRPPGMGQGPDSEKQLASGSSAHDEMSGRQPPILSAEPRVRRLAVAGWLNSVKCARSRPAFFASLKSDPRGAGGVGVYAGCGRVGAVRGARQAGRGRADAVGQA